MTQTATAKRVTLSAINAILRAKGYPDELVRGRGYFYFAGSDACAFYTQSVMTMHLSDYTVDEWVAEYEAMRAQSSARLAVARASAFRATRKGAK